MLKCYQQVNSWAWGRTVGLAARMEPGVMHPQGTCVQGAGHSSQLPVRDCDKHGKNDIKKAFAKLSVCCLLCN